jgi:hypothetical protein
MGKNKSGHQEFADELRAYYTIASLGQLGKMIYACSCESQRKFVRNPSSNIPGFHRFESDRIKFI